MSNFRDFLFNRDHSQAWALAFAMTGIRMGERALLAGDAAPLFAQLAAKVGLTGRAAVVVGSEQAAGKVAAAAAALGVLVEDVRVALPDVPVDEGAFDVAVVNAGPSLLALTADDRANLARGLHRALRTGGRVVVVEGQPPRFFGLVRGQTPGLQAFHAGGGATPLLEEAGFRPVRLLADRDGQRFTEGIKTA